MVDPLKQRCVSTHWNDPTFWLYEVERLSLGVKWLMVMMMVKGKDKDAVEIMNLYHFIAFFALAAIC